VQRRSESTAWGFSVAEDVEQLPVVGDVRWQCVQKKRIGDVHCGEQTNCGTAADDSEVLYVVSLSRHVDHLPSELRKCVKHACSQHGERQQEKSQSLRQCHIDSSTLNTEYHLLEEVRLLPNKIGGGPGHIGLCLYFEDS
jgi:hypothetical protein